MRYILITLLTLTMVGLFFTCSRKTQQTMQRHSGAEIASIMELPAGERINHFAFDLMKHISSNNDNYVVSPFSISTALAMTYAGAREQTALEMSNTLFFDPSQQNFHPAYRDYLLSLQEQAGEHVQLNIANALWAHEAYQFLPAFFSLAETYYQSRLNQVNFRGDREAIRLDINQWVYNQTREKIANLIAPSILTEDTRLVLVNAIHFLGQWLSPFTEERTRKEVFRGMGGQEAETDFMRRTGYYSYAENNHMQVIDMPYQGGQFSMVVVLPTEGTDISMVEETLTGFSFSNMLADMERTHVDLRLPRFEMETSSDLEVLLAEMGMPTAFSKRADFSGMTGDDSLMIDKVIHKAMIDVKESGTEAAAATAVVMIMKTSIEPEPEKTVVFHANRPFLFFIKDNRYNSILFMGRKGKA